MLITAFALLMIGCGGGEDGDSARRVRIDGSSTVFPITAAVAEEFRQEAPDLRVTVSVSGTGGGFEKFLRRETHINDASRPIKPSERQLAEENGVRYIELPVAYDGLAVVAHPDNDWADCLTTEELRRIWAPGSEVETWQDVRPEWPAEELSLYGPGTASGTYDYFTEAIVGESGASRSDFSASEDDNVLVEGVSGDRYSLGFFGLAYYENNRNQLKLIAVDDTSDSTAGCVKPSARTVDEGTYQPLARPLFIYVREDVAGSPAVERFVTFYFNQVSELAPQVGYVPLSSGTYELAEQRFEERTTGSVFVDGETANGAGLNERLRADR